MKDETTLKVGLRLRDFRKVTLNMTQEQFAKDMKVNQPMIVNYENGSVMPSQSFFARLAEKYGARSDFFLTGAGPQTLSSTETSKAKVDPVIRIGVLEKKIALMEKRLKFMDENLEKMLHLLEKL